VTRIALEKSLENQRFAIFFASGTDVTLHAVNYSRSEQRRTVNKSVNAQLMPILTEDGITDDGVQQISSRYKDRSEA
jgi:hypothetical protein